MDSRVLTPELAGEIADETTRILGHNVLITDENAELVGGARPWGLGTFEEAGVAVVKSGVAASHNAEEAAALVGVRPGITMPIVLDGAVIGTVGITGAPAQVVRLDRLVQRQTEMLLRESMFQRTRLLRENRLTQLVRDIVEFDPRILDERIIRAAGVELGYDLGQQRVAVLFEVQRGPESYPSSVRAIGEVFDARTDIVAELAAGRYIVLHHPSPDDADHSQSLARRAAALLRERHGVVVHIGIGESGSGVAALADSCADAKDALRLAGDSPDVEIREISHYRVRQLLDSASTTARTRFTRSQLDWLSRENDFSVLRQTIVAWCESGFNLVTTAQRLAIHRNTVIYRLDQISRLTARAIREPAVTIGLYLACLLGG